MNGLSNNEIAQMVANSDRDAASKAQKLLELRIEELERRVFALESSFNRHEKS
jgi:uncharacterized protein YceH (UPF0502 family)